MDNIGVIYSIPSQKISVPSFTYVYSDSIELAPGVYIARCCPVFSNISSHGLLQASIANKDDVSIYMRNTEYIEQNQTWYAELCTVFKISANINLCIKIHQSTNSEIDCALSSLIVAKIK